jgi:hypothetical protein
MGCIVTAAPNPPDLHVFLGGHDLEMLAIRDLAARVLGVERVSDAGLAWGARASAYGDAIAQAATEKLTPVLVELQADIPLPAGSLLIDHHGERAGGPSSLRQIYDLLGPAAGPWTRWMTLVDANDRGHISALRAIGATDAEIAQVRQADRQAQGITAAEEAAGLAALASVREVLGGSLLVGDLPHKRTATLTDPLALAGDMRDLLVICPTSVHFFGAGERILAFDAAFPGGWRGGELPQRGFWGIDRVPAERDLLEVILHLGQSAKQTTYDRTCLRRDT